MNKKMNILLIGDPHFKNNNQAETNVFVKETVSYVIKEKNNIDFIVILGDVLDTHERINLQALCRATNFIRELAKIKFVFVLVGNHDRLNNKVFLTEEHSLVGLKNNKNIQIVDKVLKYREFLFVPYVEPGRFQEALDTVDFDLNDIKAVFAHQEFYGVKMRNITSEIGDKWPVSNPPVFSGHIHGYQKVQDNIYYIGTPYQINFGESEDKGLCMLNINKDDFLLIRVYLPFIKKKTLILKADDLKELKLDNQHHWRLIIEDELKYIKAILALPEVNETIKNCQMQFKFNESEKKIDRKSYFNSSFDDILKSKMDTVDKEISSYFYSHISSTRLE